MIKAYNDLIKLTENKILTNYNIWYFVIITLIISLLGIFIYVRHKFKLQKNFDKKEITRFEIGEYIQLNLKNVSITNIKDYFNISNKSLYKTLAPEKPGSIISNYRKEKAKELLLKGESIKTISMETGFSISYLRKLKV